MKSEYYRGCNLAFTLLLVQTLTGRAVTFTNDAFISFNNTNYDGQELVLTNCTLTVDGVHGFAGLRVLNGGTLTHSFSTNGLLLNLLYITGEQHTLNITNAATLDQTNIDITSVSIANTVGATNYAAGVDYRLVRLQDGLLQVALLPGSAIPDGAIVSVSYTVVDPSISTGLNLLVTNDVEVQLGGLISASGIGYGPGFGPGAGASAATNFPYPYAAGAGGGYGGYGGSSSTRALGGGSYGTSTGPLEKGSGGGAGNGLGGVGGGAIHLTAGGNIRIDGNVSANGAEGLNPSSGGGAGGSIWLSAQTLTGAGSITANAGSGEPLSGGGGGGGRIALFCDTNRFTGNVTAFGGKGAINGGAGTIYALSGTNQVGELLIDNGGMQGTNTLFSDPITVAVTVSGGARVQPLPEPLASLTVLSNSWLVPPPDAVTGASLGLTVLQDAVIQPGGGITADGSGYWSGIGPGAGARGTLVYGPVAGGGGYGGAGGAGRTNSAGGQYYGSVTQPLDKGSGGGAASVFSSGGAGAGAIKLTVNGTLSLDGLLSANGSAGLGGGGGAGGSIWVIAGRLSGTGMISANGGSGDPLGAGGGGGGRIAVYVGTNEFAGEITAYGGPGVNYGGAGTIYTKTNKTLNAQVIVDNAGWAGTNTGLPQGESVLLTVRGGATLDASSVKTLDSLQVNGSSWVVFPVRPPIASSLTINGDVAIEAGSGLALDGAGYPAGSGPGAARENSGSGAGYGGYGGNARGNSGAGSSYGSALNLGLPGSGGAGVIGQGLVRGSGGAGGGALNLTVNGRFALDGQIRANGAAAMGFGAGGGSGGSVSLTIGTLSGSGLISANGGSGNLPFGGGGGGGRIALYCGTNKFTGFLTAYGGAGANYGGAGTIFVGTKNSRAGQIIVDNGGASGTNTDLGEVEGVDLAVQGGAIANASTFLQIRNLHIGPSSHFVFQPSVPATRTLSLSGEAVIEQGASIILDGAGQPAGSGPGAGRPLTGGGGGYGGYGGNGLTNSGGGNAYGSTTEPLDSGSAGAAIRVGGSGGGALHLTVAQQLILDGQITANGTAPLGSGGGGGSGGSLWLTVGTLSGTGLIAADGGPGDLPIGGGGGGGRIASYYGTNLFNGTMSAKGGPGAHTGGAGTIYLRANNADAGELVVDNGDQAGASTGLLVPEKFDLNITGGGAAVLGAPANLGTLAISSNSWLICSNRNVQVSTVLSASGDVTIEPGGGISLDGTGYPAGTGEGAGGIRFSAPFGQTGGGGGHGGFGGNSASGAAGGKTYDTLAQATRPGSGGGGTVVGPLVGGSGGGALQLTVNGALHLDGEISANGTDGISAGSGGGAGGTIQINAQKITGAGLISANGGAGQGAVGGGGGGGRILLTFATNAFSGSIVARGGLGAVSGGAGTILLAPAGQAQIPQVVIDNGWLRGTNTPLTPVLFPCDLMIHGGAVVTSSGQISFRNLLVTSNAWLGSPCSVTLTGDATLEAGGGIRVDGAGYSGGQGPGAGAYPKTGLPSSGGGGHGGYGGSALGGAPGGNCYGALLNPNEPGSGGGGMENLFPGGNGGGVVELTVARTLLLDGTISANGLPTLTEAGGGGSGGSILLNVSRLSGTGSIRADGGPGDPLLGGGGGGGRIALYYLTNDFTGTVSAFGAQGATWGGAGTIYSQNVSDDFGKLIVDNGGSTGTNTPIQTPQPLDLNVLGSAVAVLSTSPLLHSLVVDSGAILISSNLEPLDLTILGDALVGTNSAIAVDGEVRPLAPARGRWAPTAMAVEVVMAGKAETHLARQEGPLTVPLNNLPILAATVEWCHCWLGPVKVVARFACE